MRRKRLKDTLVDLFLCSSLLVSTVDLQAMMAQMGAGGAGGAGGMGGSE